LQVRYNSTVGQARKGKDRHVTGKDRHVCLYLARFRVIYYSVCLICLGKRDTYSIEFDSMYEMWIYKCKIYVT